MYLTVYLPKGETSSVKATAKDDIKAVLLKLCANRGLNLAELLPRLSDGTVIDISRPTDQLNVDLLVLYPKDNFETHLVTDLTAFAWNNEHDKLAKLLNLPCFQKVVNRVNTRGQAALYCAARQGATRCIVHLLKCPNIDVNVQVTEHGGTPLHAAAECVALLLSQGADINLKNKVGMTGRQEAKGAEVMDVYKNLDSGGIERLCKDFASVKQLIADLGDRGKVVNKLSLAVDQGISVDMYKSARAQAFTPEMMWTWNEHFAERLDLMDLSPIDIAQQITLIDHRLFAMVREYELIDFSGQDPYKTPNMCNYTAYFNMLSAWVATEILKTPDLVQRVVVLSFFVEVLQSLIKYNNINSSFSIQLGVRTPSLDRLKDTFAGISEYLRQYIQFVVDLCNTDKNFANLRRHLEQQHYPGVPYLGIFTKDLFAIVEGNKDRDIRDRLTQKVIDSLKVWQAQEQHPFKAIPRVQHMLLHAWTMSETDQWEISTLIEPRKKQDPTPQELIEQEKNRAVDLVKAKTKLTALGKQEELHYKGCAQKLNIFAMIAMIRQSPPDCILPCSDAEGVHIHSVIIKSRCLSLYLAVSGKDQAATYPMVAAVSGSPKKVVEALYEYFLEDTAPLDNLNVEEIFSLWDLSITLKLEHLMTSIQIYIGAASTPANLIDYAVAFSKAGERPAYTYRKTQKLLTKWPELVEASTHKETINNLLETWKVVTETPTPAKVESSWLRDFGKILDRKSFTDLQLNVKDITGREETMRVHRYLVYSQTRITSMCKNLLKPKDHKVHLKRPSPAISNYLTSQSMSVLETQTKTHEKNQTSQYLDVADDGQPVHNITVSVPMSVFQKIIHFAYTHHFGVLSAVDQVFIYATARDFCFCNHPAISTLLLHQINKMKKTEMGKLYDAVREIKDLEGCQKLHGSLALKLGKTHHIAKLFSAQATHLAEQYACIQPLIDAETSGLRKKISNLESKISKLEAENARLRGDKLSLDTTFSKRSRSTDSGDKDGKRKSGSNSSRKKKESIKHKDKSSDKGERQSPYRLVPVSEAVDIVLANTRVGEPKEVSLQDSLGLIVSESIASPEPVPPFPASVMDGYAVIAEECPGTFPVVGLVSAGTLSSIEVAPGKIAQITTGSAIPTGANAVVMVEETELVEKKEDGTEIVKLNKPARVGQFIRPVGSDIKEGQTIVEAGDQIGSPEIGLLAGAGVTRFRVYNPPTVGILSTGDELVEPHETPAKGQIRDSNRSMLLSALASENRGITGIDLGIAPDTFEQLEEVILKSLEKVDVLITSGGVSMGELDLLKPLFEKYGTVHFGRVLMKPGKPLTFVSLKIGDKDKLVFGLPGNPVSSMATFLLFCIPCIRKICGVKNPNWPVVQAKLSHPLSLDKTRPEYHRAYLKWQDGGFVAESTGIQASSRLLSFRSANSILCIPQGEGNLEQGATVDAFIIGGLHQ